jgi:hypothetical protein
MPQPIVFPCPSCGASVSAEEGDVRAQCQSCGNTAQVPAALRGAVPAAPQSVPDYTDKMGRPAMWNQAEWEVIADAVRAGDKVLAVTLYQQTFSVSQAEAQKDIDALAAGKNVTLGTRALGRPFLHMYPIRKAAGSGW